jgi:hypothetical protein
MGSSLKKKSKEQKATRSARIKCVFRDKFCSTSSPNSKEARLQHREERKRKKKHDLPNSTRKPSLTQIKEAKLRHDRHAHEFCGKESKSIREVCVKIHQATSVNERNLGVKTASQPKILPTNYQSCTDNSKENISTTNGVSPDCPNNPEEKVFRLLCLQDHRLRLATLGDSPSRARANYRQRSGARHQLTPECENSCSRPATSST